MNRREFLKGLGASGLLTLVPAGILTRLCIHSVVKASQGWDEEEHAVRTVTIGIGEFGRQVARSVARNVPRVSCLEASIGQGEVAPGAMEELFSAVRSNDLVFLVATQANRDELILLDGLGEAAMVAGNFPVAILPDDCRELTIGESTVARNPVRLPSIMMSPLSQLYDQNLFSRANGSEVQIQRYLARHVIDMVVAMATRRGMICIDLADVIAILGSGHGWIGVGVANGADRSHNAAALALSRLDAQGVSVGLASGVLVCIEGDQSMTMDEFDGISKAVHGAISEDANIIFGLYVNGLLGGNIKVTVVAVDSALVGDWSFESIL